MCVIDLTNTTQKKRLVITPNTCSNNMQLLIYLGFVAHSKGGEWMENLLASDFKSCWPRVKAIACTDATFSGSVSPEYALWPSTSLLIYCSVRELLQKVSRSWIVTKNKEKKYNEFVCIERSKAAIENYNSGAPEHIYASGCAFPAVWQYLEEKML